MLRREIDKLVYSESVDSWDRVLEAACFAVGWFTRSCHGQYRCRVLHEAVMSVDSGGFQVCHAVDLLQALRMAAEAHPWQAHRLDPIAEQLSNGIAVACA